MSKLYIVTSVANRLFVEYNLYNMPLTACPTACFCDKNVDFWVDGLKLSNLANRKFNHALSISVDQISFGGRRNLKGEVQKAPTINDIP